MFQHTAARRRLVKGFIICCLSSMFQHTAARRRLDRRRPKHLHHHGFNTQPPEGGWTVRASADGSQQWFQHTAARRRLVFPVTFFSGALRFNTQPPEGGWIKRRTISFSEVVSTHSRPKAAGETINAVLTGYTFQHTAARRRLAKTTI